MLVQEREPLVQDGFFGFFRGLLFEEDSARGVRRYVRIFFAQKVERFVVEELQSTRVERSARGGDEGEHVVLVRKKDDTTQETLRLGYKARFDFADYRECSFAADEKIDRVHLRGKEVAACVLAGRSEERRVGKECRYRR